MPPWKKLPWRKGKMKTRKGLEETLKRFKPFLREKFKVKEIGIFGSYVRGEEAEESDVDILVEFYEPIGWEFIDFKEPLIGDELPVPFHGQVPIITPSGQNKALKGEIQLDIDLGLSFTRTDSIRFEIILVDRELHESNRLVTPAIYK